MIGGRLPQEVVDLLLDTSKEYVFPPDVALTDGDSDYKSIDVIIDGAPFFRLRRMLVPVGVGHVGRWRLISWINWFHMRVLIPVGLVLSTLALVAYATSGRPVWEQVGQVCVVGVGISMVGLVCAKLALIPRSYPRFHGSGIVALRGVSAEFARRIMDRNPGSVIAAKPRR